MRKTEYNKFLLLIVAVSLSLGVELSPLGCRCGPSSAVALKFGSNVLLEEVFRVRRLQDGKEEFNDVLCVQRRHPDLVEGESADFSGVALDVGVVDFGLKVDLGVLERVVV